MPRKVFAAGVALFVFFSTRADATEFLEWANRTLSIQRSDKSFDLQLSGLVDLEGYFIDQRAPGLIFTDDSFLFNPRLTLFADIQWTRHIYVFGQFRAERRVPSSHHTDAKHRTTRQ